MTTREIQGHLEEIYGIEVSPALIFERDRGGYRGSEAVAEPAAGGAVSHGVNARSPEQLACSLQSWLTRHDFVSNYG
jgi:hypothetical protein